MTGEKGDLAALKIDRDAGAAGGRSVGIVLLLALGAGLLIFGAFWFWRSRSATAVTVAAARQGASSAPTVLNASGYVTPRRKATVSSEITGRVKEMRVEEGMKVQAGQILALLDDAEWRAQYDVALAEREVAVRSVAEAEATLAEARSTLKRTREIVSSGLVSAQELERAETQVSVLESRLNLSRQQVLAADKRIAQAAQNLDNCTVRSPFGGIAISKDAQAGEIVSPVSAGGGFTRTGISTIVDMTSLEIEVDVNEANIARVRPGQPVSATLDAYPDWQIPCSVRTTIPAADRQKATVKVRVTFDKLDPRILPDMGVKVAFLQDARSSDSAAAQPLVLVPKGAVREENGAHVVFVIKGGRLERRAVRLGGVSGDEAQIVAGLRDGEKVVAQVTPALRDGERVEAKP
jgi:RND family efflux transporter MFP subunit